MRIFNLFPSTPRDLTCIPVFSKRSYSNCTKKRVTPFKPQTCMRFCKINKPTLTAKSSLNSDLAQRLHEQTSLTGESALNTELLYATTIPNLDVTVST